MGSGLTKRLTVRVSPQARQDSIDGWFLHQWQPVLKVRVKAPPEEGAANVAVEALLSEALKLSKQHIRLLLGCRSKTKVFEIQLLAPQGWKLFLERTQFPEDFPPL